ncbi:MAG: glycoside hydrolase family 88 protein [Candidatus Symbiothrix sp.]|jgi:rhamnogalacturonyl hydrolase YesR|nr:glycoside hydrolase family 88 protein [Candidatus Symbiothrix sp.]
MQKYFFTLLCLCLSHFTCLGEIGKQINRSDIENTLRKVIDWQITHLSYSTEGSAGHLHDYGINAWTNGVLYLGMAEWAKIPGNDAFLSEYLLEIGEKSQWRIAENFTETKYGIYHADELCAGQFYLEMYRSEQDSKMLESTKNRIDQIIANPPDTSMHIKNKQSWTWCDALFMAPPVYVRAAALTKDDTYLQFMDKEFKRTYCYLYNKDEKLFFRDDSYFDKQEQNGRKVFWGRGNGWVAAGLVNILKYLPTDSPYRPFYEDLFKEFVPHLVSFQDKSGFWHASLLDSESYPSPEASATALITYALAYGINKDLLNKDAYLPAVIKAWEALSGAIDEDGKLGWIQPIGADPRKVTEEMTAVYGVGAFLMAGSEIYQIIK